MKPFNKFQPVITLILCSFFSFIPPDNNDYKVKFNGKVDLENLFSSNNWKNAELIATFVQPWKNNPGQKT